jgi:DNA-binding response OmpR family regulator
LKTPILFVEDDPSARELMTVCLESTQEYKVTVAASKGEAVALLSQPDMPFKAIVLDLGLPDGDGRDVIKHMVNRSVLLPVIMLTSEGDPDVIVDALDKGAIDYVAKPCVPGILRARIRAAVRSFHRTEQNIFQLGHWEFKAADRTLFDRSAGKKIVLTQKETFILKLLLSKRGSTVRRQELLTEVWHYQANARTHTVESHFYRLRQKIEKDPAQPEILLSGDGGYRVQARA